MLHDCGPDSSCYLGDGKCAKKYPKEYAHQTVISAERYPEYMRRRPKPLDAPDEEEVAAEPEPEDTHEENPIQYQRRDFTTATPMNKEDAEKYGCSIWKKIKGNTFKQIDNRQANRQSPTLFLPP
jgi:hypothetical protein